MSYLVLGSTSFAGSSLINYLLSRGESVIGISRSIQPHPVMQPYHDNPHLSSFQFFQYDLNNDLKSIKQLIKDYKPQYIIDFAGQGMVAESWSDPAQWFLTNIVAKEYQMINPSTPYAISHAAIDMSLLAFFKQYQFPIILARFANFYGPHQQLYRIIPRTMIYASLNKKLPLHGGGVSERMFIYADDVSDAIYKTIQHGKIGEVYHFSNQPCLSIRNLIEKICSLMNIEISSFVEIVEERAGKDNKYEMDTTKAETELGWKPVYSLEQGLEKTIHWIKQNIDVIKTLPLQYIHKP